MVDSKKRLAGMALAATAAALFMSGCADMGSGGGSSAKVQCQGVNACKGLSDCQTANSSCQGQNACKGQGYVSLTAEECQKVSGKA
ncbi:MAG: BufA2 family periplasmic bufferin-type metallophore [Betaproteobacteria bacterium]